jgi:dolichol-phosphate mannosyltransferase
MGESQAPTKAKASMTPPSPRTRLRRLLDRWLAGDRARFLRFALVGGSGVLVNEGVLFLFADVLLRGAGDLRIPVAGIVAIGVSILTNFVLNDAWTWGDRDKLGRLHFFQRLGKYYLVAAAAAALNYGLLLLLWRVAGMHHLVANLVGIAVAMVLNFFVQNRWTFAR